MVEKEVRNSIELMIIFGRLLTKILLFRVSWQKQTKNAVNIRKWQSAKAKKIREMRKLWEMGEKLD